MKNIGETLVTVPHYIDGETFSFHVPCDLIKLDLKIPRKVRYGELPWSPWPTKRGIERKMGPWLLKLHDTETYTKGYGKNAKQIPHKLVRLEAGDPNVWYLYSFENYGSVESLKMTFLGGRHIRSVLDEDFPHVKHVNGDSNSEWYILFRKLNTPTPIDTLILNKVYGRSRYRIHQQYSYLEFVDRVNQFELDLEWYRKELIKLQRKLQNEQKKKKAEKLGITVADIEEQKRKEEEIAKAAQLTQEWIDISRTVFKSLDFLNEVVKQMGHRQTLDREWFDKNRRDLRELANVMRPLNKHFPKKKSDQR